MQGIADGFDLSAKINACVCYQSLINTFNIDMKSELGCDNLFPSYPWMLLPLSVFFYNENIKMQGRGNDDKAAGFQYVISEFCFVELIFCITELFICIYLYCRSMWRCWAMLHRTGDHTGWPLVQQRHTVNLEGKETGSR